MDFEKLVDLVDDVKLVSWYVKKKNLLIIVVLVSFLLFLSCLFWM